MEDKSDCAESRTIRLRQPIGTGAAAACRCSGPARLQQVGAKSTGGPYRYRFFLHDPTRAQPHLRPESRALFVALLLQPASRPHVLRHYQGGSPPNAHWNHVSIRVCVSYTIRVRDVHSRRARGSDSVRARHGRIRTGNAGSLTQQPAAASGRRPTSIDGAAHRACYRHSGNGGARDTHVGR